MVDSNSPLIKTYPKALGYITFMTTHMSSSATNVLLLPFILAFEAYFLHNLSKGCARIFNLAKALAFGRRLALAPYVLGHLYRIYFELFCNPFLPNQGGPIWILQVWVNAYFLWFYSQTPRDFFTPHGVYYTMLPTTEKTFFELISFFFNLPANRPNFYFQPFLTS